MNRSLYLVFNLEPRVLGLDLGTHRICRLSVDRGSQGPALSVCQVSLSISTCVQVASWEPKGSML
jgi:hypothetical protein